MVYFETTDTSDFGMNPGNMSICSYKESFTSRRPAGITQVTTKLNSIELI